MFCLGCSINTEFKYADGRTFSGLDGKLDLVMTGGQVVGKYNGTGIMESSAVTVVKIDASLSFPVDYEFQNCCVRTGANKGTDGLTLELQADGFARGFAVKQRPA